MKRHEQQAGTGCSDTSNVLTASTIKSPKMGAAATAAQGPSSTVMQKLPIPKEEVEIAKMLVLHTINLLHKKYKRPMKSFDSNLMHFIIYEVSKEMDIKLTSGWYIHGPYVPAVDDALVELGMMDPKYHQWTGTDNSVHEPLIAFEDEPPRVA